MAQSPFRERHYQAEEVRGILRRALANGGKDEHGGTGLSHRELEHLLNALGVSEADAEAPAEIGATAGGAPAREFYLLGAPPRLILEREVDGRLTESKRQDVLERVRDALDDQGVVESSEQALVWKMTAKTGGQPRRLTVKIRTRDERTRIRIDEDLAPQRSGAAVLCMFFVLPFVTMVLTGVRHRYFASSVAFFVLVGGLVALHSWMKADSKRRKRELEHLFEKLHVDLADRATPRARVLIAPEAPSETVIEALAQEEAEEAEASGRAYRA